MMACETEPSDAEIGRAVQSVHSEKQSGDQWARPRADSECIGALRRTETSVRWSSTSSRPGAGFAAEIDLHSCAASSCPKNTHGYAVASSHPVPAIPSTASDFHLSVHLQAPRLIVLVLAHNTASHRTTLHAPHPAPVTARLAKAAWRRHACGRRRRPRLIVRERRSVE